jgi:hypothetical protein
MIHNAARRENQSENAGLTKEFKKCPHLRGGNAAIAREKKASRRFRPSFRCEQLKPHAPRMMRPSSSAALTARACQR